MRSAKTACTLLVMIILVMPAAIADENVKWQYFCVLEGRWSGEGEGRWGNSTIEREYEFIMEGTFLRGLSKSLYPEQERNPEGEIHDSMDIFSYDKLRKKYVLRQFHAEDIINQYVVDSVGVTLEGFEFVSEAIENFGTGWKAKEVYAFVNDDEFIETFWLAAPGEDYKLYVTNHFYRSD